MTDENRLKSIAASGDRDTLEEAWLEELEKPGPATVFTAALDALPEEVCAEVSRALLPLVLEIYMELERSEDALIVALRLAPFEPLSRPLRRHLVKLFHAVHGKEEWFEVFFKSCGMDDEAPLPEAVARFDAYEPFKPGSPVEHKAGWGPGVVDGYNNDDNEVRIKFHDGAKRELPLQSCIDSLTVMDREDLRAMVLIDPEGLQALAEEDPGEVVRRAVKLARGKAAASRIKELLVDKAVPAKAWTRWWTKAKKAAARHPWIKIEGGSRPVFFLRDKPVSMNDASIAAVRDAVNLEKAVAAVRAIIHSSPDKDLMTEMLDEIARRMENGGASSDSIRLEAALLLEEYGREVDNGSAAIYQGAEEEGEHGAIDLLGSISAKGRKVALLAFEKAFPEEWPSTLALGFHLLPRELMKQTLEAALSQPMGRELLIERWQEIDTEPWKYPWALFHLGRKIVSGELAGEGAPSEHVAVLAMLRCLEASLFHKTHDRAVVRDVLKYYEDYLLEPKHGVLEHFLDEAERPLLVRAYGMVHITSMLPKAITDRLAISIPSRFRDLKETVEIAFWESGGIFCTRAGIEKRRLDLKVLVEDKLPEVAKAIGRAASFGDLSENAEWEAAVEEQRLLSQRAKTMNEDLLTAQLLEEQTLPEEMVAPGTKVTYRVVESGETKDLTILGPWDVGEEGIVSYEAPLAAGFLGLRVGEETTISLPSGDMAIVVESVEPVFEKAKQGD